jgi:hypothetical protein
MIGIGTIYGSGIVIELITPTSLQEILLSVCLVIGIVGSVEEIAP